MPAETVSDNVETLINLALAEDFGSGDVTSTYFVPEHLTARAILTLSLIHISEPTRH